MTPNPKSFRPTAAAAAALERLATGGKSESRVLNELLEAADEKLIPSRVTELEQRVATLEERLARLESP